MSTSSRLSSSVVPYTLPAPTASRPGANIIPFDLVGLPFIPGRYKVPFCSHENLSFVHPPLNNRSSDVGTLEDDLFSKSAQSVIKLDFVEIDDEYGVRAELPGVNKSDIELLVDAPNMVLIIKVKKSATAIANRPIKVSRVVMREKDMWGDYSAERKIQLPQDAIVHSNGSKVRTSFENGLLDIRFPKLPRKKQKIEIMGYLTDGGPTVLTAPQPTEVKAKEKSLSDEPASSSSRTEQL